MGIFRSNPIEKVTQKSYKERLDDIKSIFANAYDRASVVMTEMQSEIEVKKAQVEDLNEQIKNISLIQADASTLMSDLKKFI